MAKQIREFPKKAVCVMSNMDPDPMATKCCRLEASSLKYLSASQEEVSIYAPVNFAAENSNAFMTLFDANR